MKSSGALWNIWAYILIGLYVVAVLGTAIFRAL
jgi:hypothetical protein